MDALAAGVRDAEVRSVFLMYDVAHAKRLRRVARQAEAAGLRLQKSVFECSLTPGQGLALQARLLKVLDLDEDRVLFQPQCAHCRSKNRWQGAPLPVAFAGYWVV